MCISDFLHFEATSVLSERTYIDKKVSHYRLLDTISSSSFCHVYRAEHLQIAQYIVAIKVFQTPSLSPHKRQQFLEEVQLLSKLKNPHILPILDPRIRLYSPIFI